MIICDCSLSQAVKAIPISCKPLDLPIKSISFLGGVITSYGVNDFEEWVGCCPGLIGVELEITNATPYLVEKYCKDYGCEFTFYDQKFLCIIYIKMNFEKKHFL